MEAFEEQAECLNKCFFDVFSLYMSFYHQSKTALLKSLFSLKYSTKNRVSSLHYKIIFKAVLYLVIWKNG